MPLQATSGAASYDAFGGGAAAVPQYIEDVFSTWLYQGTGATQTITNGIDLSTYGGMVWMKNRVTAYNNAVVDSARGLTSGRILYTNSTAAQQTGFPENTAGISAFNTTGFTLRSDANGVGTNYGVGENEVSWTFRKQPKFFDIVTYTGDGSNMTISHNLGSVPGCIFVKRTNTTGNWSVYHTSLGNTKYLRLNTTDAAVTDSTAWNNTTPTSTTFTVGTNLTGSGDTYVAYLFAHDAGGFGLTGTDNVISCGTFTGSGAGVATTVTLGYEPQFIIAKRTDAAQNWVMFDNMRGFDNTNAARLFPNLSNAESVSSASGYFTPTATGFKYGPSNFMGDTANIIYIAIRRGPMKVPTDATTVFSPATSSAAAGTPITTGFPIDLQIATERVGSTNNIFYDRLRGVSTTTTQSAQSLVSNLTNAEVSPTTAVRNWGSTGFEIDSRHASSSTVYENFRRAPSFFDEVCYTGDGTDDRQVAHNLGVAPELIINKNRGAAWPWWVGGSVLGSTQYGLYLNTNGALQSNPSPKAFSTNGASFTSTYFLVSSVSAYPPNASSYTNVAYLFATCPGVSKVGTYTGNGTTQTINCGFTGGARFVLIKRTDSTGDWYMYDTARGMTVLTDPYLLLNSDTAETATLGSVTTVSTGFAVNASILAAINTNGASYIYLSIA